MKVAINKQKYNADRLSLENETRVICGCLCRRINKQCWINDAFRQNNKANSQRTVYEVITF